MAEQSGIRGVVIVGHSVVHVHPRHLKGYVRIAIHQEFGSDEKFPTIKVLLTVKFEDKHWSD